MPNELEDIYRIEFHSPLFFAGRNFGTKVEVHKTPGLKIGYDEKYGLFRLSYKDAKGFDRKATASDTSAFLWELMVDQPGEEVVNEHKTMDVNKIKGAQVSTPMGHVFEGIAAGQTSQTRVKK